MSNASRLSLARCVVVITAFGCGESRAREEDERQSIVVEPSPAIPPARRCGEAGRHPTELPPDVARGTAIGGGTLRPGESRQVGSVRLRYEPPERDQYGLGVVRMVDDVDSETVFVEPDFRDQKQVGDHRVDLRVGTQAPYAVAFEVTDRSCPSYAQLQHSREPQSAWLSTEGIVLHQLEPGTDRLRLTLTEDHGVPIVRVREGAFATDIRLLPETRTQIRANGHLVSIEEVIPGPGTSLDAGWRYDVRLKVHVRVGIAPAPEIVAHQAARAAEGCGGPSAEPTMVPDVLAAVAPVVDERHLEYHEPATVGPFALEYEAQRYLDARGPGMLSARLPDGTEITQRHDDGHGASALRMGRSLLRLDPVDYEVHVRHLRVRCPAEVAVSSLDAPTHVWLSTLGHRIAAVGDPPRLAVSLEPDVETPMIVANAGPDRVYARLAEPDAVGDAFTVGDAVVEIVEVTSGENTRFVDGRWHTSATFPAVHVQVRLSPSDRRS